MDAASAPSQPSVGFRDARWVQVVLALLLAAMATGLCALADGHLSPAAMAMVYLVAVVAAAGLLERWAGVLASVLSVSALNWFFVPPRYTFEVDSPEYLLTLAVLLAVSLGINALVAALRDGRARAQQREAQATQLHALSEHLAAHAADAALPELALDWLVSQLGRPCGIYLDARMDGPPRLPVPVPTLQRVAASGLSPTSFNDKAALWTVQNRKTAGRGQPDWSDLPLVCAPFNRQSPGGAVQWLWPEATGPDEPMTRHLEAVARQVGLALERQQASAQAIAAQAQAQTQATRNAMLAALSHDLRTPLAGMIGSASALREQGARLSDAQRERLLLNLENEARDLTSMADNILQTARFSQDPGAAGLRLQWESVEEIVGVAVQRARRRWPERRFAVRVPGELPPVHAEGSLLAQVVGNLLDNAARISPPGAPVAVQAGRTRTGVFVAVRDQGPGLPAGEPAALFQAAPAHGAAFEGAGLGLSICRLIVQAHGGTIAARRLDTGAEFMIELPAAQPMEAPS